MKNLIFIDNDNINQSKKDVEMYVIPALQSYGGLDKKYSESIEIISDLYDKSKDELYNIFFSGKNAIISWSVYTSTSFSNSKNQLYHFLRVAGVCSVKDILYLDISGMVEKALLDIKYKEGVGIFNMLEGIENNNIVTLVEGKFYLLRLDLRNLSFIKREEVSILELLN